MVQQFKCRLGYNGAAAAGHRWRLCDCLDRVTLKYSCKLKPKDETAMGILSDDKQNSGFLKKENCPGPGKAQGMLATVTDFTMADVSRADQPTEMKPILHSKEHSPMVLNPTNRDWLLGRFGDDQKCVGMVILIWNDPDVEFPRGTKVGGLRLADRIEREQARNAAAPFDDDIPFGE